MATNNYFGFPHGATQYGTTAPGTAYPTTQTGYAVAPAPTPAAPSYGTARPTGYDPAYQPAATPGTYATTATAATYDYGYGRTTQTYDTSKTYYQQAAGATAGYSTPTGYDAGGTAPKVIAGFQPAQATAYAPQPARGSLPPAKAGQQYQQTTQHQPATAPQPQAYVPTQPTGYSQTVTTVHTTPKSAAVAGTVVPNNSATYPGYDAALYGATTMYVTQQQQQPPPNTKAPANVPGGGGAMPGAPGGAAVITSGPVPAGGSWPNYKSGKGGMQGHGHGHGGGPYKARKPAPKPMLIHYCDVCKISCAGPQTYREHLEGQKHKKRELLLKQAAEPGGTAPARPPNSLHCELCGVTCTGNDAYAAHVRGAKHQKVVKLHTKLGKPIPACDPTPNADGEKKESAAGESSDAAGGGGAAAGANNAGGGGGVGGGAESSEESVRPVGSEFIEEIKDDDGKLVSFSCKLCECKFNDPNAKEMHMKGRRHRLQYKKKVQPDLVVDIKPTVKQKKIAEARAHRQAMQEEFWNRRRMADAEMEEEHGMRTFGRHPFFGMLPGRRPESSDDRHVVARHAEIYPKEEELQTIQRIVSHTERALKLVSDVMTSGGGGTTGSVPAAQSAPAATAPVAAGAPSEQKTEPTNDQSKEQEIQSQQPSTTAGNGNEKANQMISFHKETEGTTIRLLKGVMRVGLLAKGLLLHGDNCVQLVVLCAEKPTTSLLKRVATELPIQLKKIAEDHRYTVTMAPVEGAVLVTDGTITVKISLTSPLLREANAPSAEQAAQNTEDLLPREPCLQALAALRHAKWFQARATGLQSCVMIMRIMRDLCQRIPIWSHISQWAMELLLEKIISSAGEVLTPGECLRRVMEAISSAILINGPGLLDPCEKEPEDTLAGLSKQQREDITVSAQMFLRCIAFRQIYKVLGIEPLPPPKFAGSRNWRFNRKRRRSGTEGNDSEADGSKMLKKDESGASSASSGAVSATGTNNATAGKMETSQ
ncbi:zinc finger RNA-binding protein 2 isoform X3 [Anopheles merus]|uniref:zinc finger RNA-binding protein 2 isoform X3 n=1 Tax=Anopheles merus TaxID=30066 RepID=UPI001BE499A0|nr:zinc finger RNA-binding protein 2 isoform X3 [Anopheles merus]